MAANHSNLTGSMHRSGHTMGDLPKRTSIGNGKRKRGSYKRTKAYKGQGR